MADDCIHDSKNQFNLANTKLGTQQQKKCFIKIRKKSAQIKKKYTLYEDIAL